MASAGERIADYSLVRELGKGGNGEVWLANGPDGEVAIKILGRTSASGDRGPRFSREIQALEILKDVPGVLPILRSGSSGEGQGQRRWYTMPVAAPLKDQLGAGAGLQSICGAIGALAAALARVHGKGISHRDIKPENLYWWNGQWCLGDFGLADWREATPLTDGERKVGPAFYIAPEMLNDPCRADCRPADVYSLGKVLWVLASGQRYPLGGAHEPGRIGVSLASLIAHPLAASVDEVLLGMSQHDPASRPHAETVASELGVVSAYRKADSDLPDTTTTLLDLRAAIQPHLSREAEEKRLAALVADLGAELEKCVEEIAAEVEEAVGLDSEEWYDHPNYWSHRLALGTSRITDTGGIGRAFTAGGQTWQWRLGIGAQWQLLSDGSVHLAGGYAMDRLFGGQPRNNMGRGTPWHHFGSAPVGAPSCVLLLDAIRSGMRANLASVVQEYASLVRSAI